MIIITKIDIFVAPYQLISLITKDVYLNDYLYVIHNINNSIEIKIKISPCEKKNLTV